MPSVMPPEEVAYLKRTGGWIPEPWRSIAVSTRPWSVPISLVPAILAIACVWDRVSWATAPAAAAAIVSVITAHLGANLVNTYVDYVRGVDTRSHADDRALVDSRVAPRTVAGLAAVMLTVAACAGVYTAMVVGWGAGAFNNAVLLGLGLGLGVGYTAGPVGLKYIGLGDITVAACFGPLLMVGVSRAAAGDASLTSTAVLIASVPHALLTAAVLHANNTRDVVPDRRAGAATLASFIGFSASSVLYAAYIACAMVVGVVGLVYLGFHSANLLHLDPISALPAAVEYAAQCVDWRASWVEARIVRDVAAQRLPPCSSSPPIIVIHTTVHTVRAVLFLLAITTPWAVELVRRFRARALKELPQATAQFALLFGAAWLAGTLPLHHLGRACLGLLFYLGGFNNILTWHHASRLVHARLNTILTLPGWFTALATALATAAQLTASVAFILDWNAKAAGLVLLVFLIPVTSVIHAFWNADYDETMEVVDVDDEGSPSPITIASPISRPPPAATTPAPSVRRRRAGSVAAPAPGPSSLATTSMPPAKVAIPHAAIYHPPAPPVPTFMTDFDNEFVHYFKNVLTMGGLMWFVATSGATQ